MAEKNIHAGHRSRLRKRFASAPSSFELHELLELLLFYSIPQKDTNPLAHELVSRFGSLGNILSASPEQLKTVPGMGDASVQLFQVLMHTVRQYLREKSSGVKLTDVNSTSEFVGEKLRSEFLGQTKEVVMVIGLNRRWNVVGTSVVGQGDFNSASINMRQISEFVLLRQPAYLILAHNHPSGVGLPSEADYAATDTVRTFVEHLNVVLLDHIIFDGSGDYVSFRESGFFGDAHRPNYQISLREPDPEPEKSFDLEEFFRTPLVAEIMTKMQNNEDQP